MQRMLFRVIGRIGHAEKPSQRFNLSDSSHVPLSSARARISVQSRLLPQHVVGCVSLQWSPTGCRCPCSCSKQRAAGKASSRQCRAAVPEMSGINHITDEGGSAHHANGLAAVSSRHTEMQCPLVRPCPGNCSLGPTHRQALGASAVRDPLKHTLERYR